MFVVMGATGHIGSVVVDQLLEQGCSVLGLVHTPDNAAVLDTRGALTAVVDVHDTDGLAAAFSRGRRAFLLNPPADPAGDTDSEERSTVASILRALRGSGLEKVVAASTMGAQAGERLGDLNTLYELEQGLAAQPIPAAIDRGAYYFTNWDMQLEAVRDRGVLQTLFPADFALPMVAPADLGVVAARRLTSDIRDVGIIEIEGPARHTPTDVAREFSDALGRPVRVEAVARDTFVETFRASGFSDAAAASYARMTEATLDQPFTAPSETEKGDTTLAAYLRGLATS